MSAKVTVVFVEPILAGWSEDIEVNRVLECFGGVRQIGRNDDDFAGVNGLGGAVVEVEAERAFDDEG